jgi:hypothetical protein
VLLAIGLAGVMLGQIVRTVWQLVDRYRDGSMR